MPPPVIWALTDARAGHTAQTLGLAHALGGLVCEKPIRHTRLSGLPNRLLGASLIGINAESRDSLRAPWPAITIATGRRMVPLMRYIRRHSPTTRLIQCMWPGPGTIEPFDLLVVPQHDHPPSDAKIVTTLGMVHGITERALEDARITFHSLVNPLPRPRVAVMIGGPSKHNRMNRTDIARLADLSELMAGSGSLLITTSRRTPSWVVSFLRDRLTCPYHLHEYGSEEKNPYLGYLAHADGIVVSADSVAMLSEACYTGKSVHVFTPHGQPRVKHAEFVQSLIDLGYAFPLLADSSLEEIPANSLDEREKIVSIVKSLDFF